MLTWTPLRASHCIIDEVYLCATYGQGLHAHLHAHVHAHQGLRGTLEAAWHTYEASEFPCVRIHKNFWHDTDMNKRAIRGLVQQTVSCVCAEMPRQVGSWEIVLDEIQATA